MVHDKHNILCTNSLQVIFPRLFHSIKSAIKPILSINKTGVNVRTLFSQLQLQQDPDEEENESESM